MNNIPVYRAKKIDSDEYVQGFYMPNHVIGDYESDEEEEREEWTEHFIMSGFSQDTWEEEDHYYIHENMTEIDPTTLSIHFLGMTDLKGNKIFASLSEDGKGGDIGLSEDSEDKLGDPFIFSSGGVLPYFDSYDYYKVIGIKE